MAILTFEEQERRAYISGNTREAVLLAALDDAAADTSEREALLEDQLADAKRETQDATDAADALREQLRALGEVPCA